MSKIIRLNQSCNPLISIIIPNYNKAIYLREALNSIVFQTYNNWEVIIVDDDSTDNSKEIIEEFSQTDQRIRFIQRQSETKGGSVCRNIGIEQAKGELMMFFDSDDLMAPPCLEQRANFMQRYPEIDMSVFLVGTFYKVIGDNKMVWSPGKSNHLKKFLRHDLPWHTMSPIWKTAFVKNELNGFDERFPRLQDVEFHTRALMVPRIKYKISSIEIPECFYRIDQLRSQQSHLQMLQKMLPGIELFVKKFEDLLHSRFLKMQLRGTLLSYLTQVNFFRVQGWIDHNDYSNLINQVNQIVTRSNVFSKTSLLLIKLYNKHYQLGLQKLKGFNYISRMIIIYL